MKRRRLATELRRLREAAGLTLDEVAEQAEWSNAKVSRIENARVSVMPRDAKVLARIYGASQEATDLLAALARESRQKGWWHSHNDAIPDWFEVYVGLESDASALFLYEAEFIPGLFQTKRYIHAAYETSLVMEEAEVEKRVALRIARQDRLTGADAPHVWAIINEAALRRVVGGPEVMAEQLKHLADVGKQPNVTIQVLPFSVGAHPAMVGAFHVLGFAENDPKIAYIEYHTGTLYLEKAREVERYTMMFDHLRAASLPPGESIALIARVADELTGSAAS